jgi:hypothetical protein
MLNELRNRLLSFRDLLLALYKRDQIAQRRRRAGESVRDSLSRMAATRTNFYLPVLFEEALRAQNAYIQAKTEKVHYDLQDRLFQLTMTILDTLAGKDADAQGRESVLNLALAEIQNWQATFKDASSRLEENARSHDEYRLRKQQVIVRKYLTDVAFEDQLYQQTENRPQVEKKVLGREGQVRGLEFVRRDPTVVLQYDLKTTWSKEAHDSQELADEFFKGAKKLFVSVRDQVSVADRIATIYDTPTGFVNKCGGITEPFLRYNQSVNGRALIAERYVSVNTSSIHTDEGRRFFSQAAGILRERGIVFDDQTESKVAATVLELSRGVRLTAVQQFVECQGDYRTKLGKGVESIHIFPEEQHATDLERQINALGEGGNQQRALSPEVVLALGDLAKLRAFLLALVTGLISRGEIADEEGQRSSELILAYNAGRNLEHAHQVQLTNSSSIRKLEPKYAELPEDHKGARLTLDALQTFVLRASALRGVYDDMISDLMNALEKRGARFRDLERPLSLRLKDINDAVYRKVEEEVKKTHDPITDMARAQGLRDLLNKYLDKEVKACMKQSDDWRVKDLGTVFHLVIRDLISEQEALIK